MLPNLPPDVLELVLDSLEGRQYLALVAACRPLVDAVHARLLEEAVDRFVMMLVALLDAYACDW
eukprot:2541156-Prymnesium_polylepis.1